MSGVKNDNLEFFEFRVPPTEFEEDVGSKILDTWLWERRELLPSLVPLWMKVILMGQMWDWSQCQSGRLWQKGALTFRA